MGLVELTQDLSNFKWTNYAKVGSSTSALSGRHNPAENVSPQTEQMESAFGQITSAVDFFSNVNAQGFTKFFISKDNSQFIGITEEGYAYPMSNGVSLGIENDVPTTDYFSGIQGTWGPNTLPLGFTKNMVIDSLLAPTPEGSEIPILSLDTLRHTIPAVGLSPSFTIDYSRYDVLLGSQFNSVDGIISSQYMDSEQLHSSYGTEFHISGFSRGDMYIANIDEPSTPEHSIFTRGSAGLGRITFDSPYFGEDVFLSDIPYAIPEVTTTGPTTSPISAQTFDDTPIAENAHGSDFFTTPLENYISQFSVDDLQTAIDSGFDRGDMYIIDHPHQSHPIFKTFTQGSAGLGRIDLTSPNFDPWTFEDDIPYVIPQHDSSGPTEFTIESFDDTPIAENAHGSDFFTTPLANYTSQFSAEDLQTDIDSGFDRGDMYITDHPHQSHPTFKTFTRGSAGLGKIGLTSPNFNPFEFGTGLPYVIPQHTSTGPEEFTTVLFDDTPEVANAHGSDYLTLPLVGYTSQFQPNTGNWGDYGIPHSTDIFHTLELENSKFYTAFGKSPSTNFYFNPPFTHLSLNQTPFLYEFETEETNEDGSPIFETAFGWKGGSIHIPSDVSVAAVLGGGVSYYGSLVSITPRSSIYRTADGTYQVPQLGGNTLPPGETSGIPLFEGTQITHDISTDYTFDTQLGNWPVGSPLFGNLGWTSTGTYVGTITLPPVIEDYRSLIQDVYEDTDLIWAGKSSINTDTPQSSLFGTDFTPATPWEDMTFIESTKERKVYQHHFLTSPFTPITVGTDLFDETGINQSWKGGSIHIVSGDTTSGPWNWLLSNDNYLSRINLGMIGVGYEQSYITFPYEDDSSVPPSIFQYGDESPHTLQRPSHFGSNLQLSGENAMSSLLGTTWGLSRYVAGGDIFTIDSSQWYSHSGLDPAVQLGRITVELQAPNWTYDETTEEWSYDVFDMVDYGGSPNFDRSGNLLYFGPDGEFPSRYPYEIPAISTTGPWTGNSNVGPFTFLTQLGGASSPGLGNIGWSWDLKYGDTIKSGNRIDLGTSQLGYGGTWADRVFTSGVAPLTEPYDIPIPAGFLNIEFEPAVEGDHIPVSDNFHWQPWNTLKNRFASDGYTSYITVDVRKDNAKHHGGLATLDWKGQWKERDTNFGVPESIGITTLKFHHKSPNDPNDQDQPYIIRKIGDRWGGVKHSGNTMDFFGRGGFKTQWDRAFKDVGRIGNWVSDNPLWLLNQFALQLMQPRPEQRLYNIGLHLGSVLPYVHLPRFLPISFFINTQSFGPFAGKTYNIPFLGAITLGGKIGDSKYPGSYVSAQDYKDEEGGLDHTSIPWPEKDDGEPINLSRLTSHTNAFFIGDTKDEEKVLKKRQTLAQLTFMTPGGYSGGWQGFGSVPTRDVDSTKHGGVLGTGKDDIHISKGGIATGTGANLDKYQFVSYGDISLENSYLSKIQHSKVEELTKSIEDAKKLKDEIDENWSDMKDAMKVMGSIEAAGSTAAELLELANKHREADSDYKKAMVLLASYQLKRLNYGKVVDSIGNQGKPGTRAKITPDKDLGDIKKGELGNFINELTDKVNMIPDGSDYPDGVKDFVKFKFKDVVGGRFIIFRAILNSISDSITPEYAEERYIGRPDKVYVYQGADREISFNFSVYPKTKQELPVLWDKLNYLVGLCYPTMKDLKFGLGQRMISPFITLTIGDMFNNAAGLLSSLSITVEDNTTWEIQEGLQLPKYISADCTFKYIGNNELTTGSAFYDHKRITFPENVVAETGESLTPAGGDQPSASPGPG